MGRVPLPQTAKGATMGQYESLRDTGEECKYHAVFIPECRQIVRGRLAPSRGGRNFRLNFPRVLNANLAQLNSAILFCVNEPAKTGARKSGMTHARVCLEGKRGVLMNRFTRCNRLVCVIEALA
jgi:hypothetical protein